MKWIFYLFVVSVVFTSCGDSDSRYITSINNNTDYEIAVHLFEDSTIICQSNQETIIEDYYAGSVKKMSCMAPYIFTNNEAEIIIDDGNKILIKDISDDNNWSCSGEEDWSLIMVGSYYIEIKTTFVVNDEDIKDVEL